MQCETGHIERLRDYLNTLPTAEIPRSARGTVIDLLTECWLELVGNDYNNMAPWRLDRMREIFWRPPFLRFLIERHPAETAVIYRWEVNFDEKTVHSDPTYSDDVSTVSTALMEFTMKTTHPTEVYGVFSGFIEEWAVFRYHLPDHVPSAEVAFDMIARTAAEERWAVAKRCADEVRFLRSENEFGGVTLEETRVVVPQNIRQVFVAYLTSRQRGIVTRIEDTDEGKWAVRELWPMFATYIEDMKGPPRSEGKRLAAIPFPID